MAIAIDTVQQSSTNVTTLSIPVTVGNNSDRVLVVGYSAEGATPGTDYDISSVAWSGTSLSSQTSLRYNNGTNAVDFVSYWYLLNPLAGSSTVEVTIANDPLGASVTVISLYNVAQQAPEASGTDQSITSDTYTSVTLNSMTAGAWMVDVVANSSSTQDMTPDAGQTEQSEQSASARHNTSTRNVAGGGTATNGWTRASGQRCGLAVAAWVPSSTVTTTGFATGFMTTNTLYWGN